MRIATEEPEELEAVMEIRDDEGEVGEMPLIRERVSVTIDNQHASTTVKQTYRNRTRSVVEGRYKLVAGSAAKVDGFAYWNGEQKIVGEVFEKQDAHRVYDEVTSRRRDPGLLDEIKPGAFAFKIFPIQPNEDKRVEINYTQWLTRNGKSIRYRAPMAGSKSEIVIDIRSDRPVKHVRSSSHTITVDPLRSGGVRVRATSKRKAKSFELSYELVEKAWHVSAYIHRDANHDGYFAVSLAAPSNLERKVAAKDVTIVLDRSGSMSGVPLAQAKKAAADIIGRLGKDDRLNVVPFDDDVDPLFDEPARASDRNRKRAVKFINRIDAGGGTNIAWALKSAMNAQSSSKRPKVVLFLTDGASDAEKALAVAREDKRDVRVFTVGIGEGVNEALLSRLAKTKRGQYAAISDERDVERNIGLIYKQIARPLLVDVSFDVTGAATDRRVYPRSVPDLFVDDELLLRGRLRSDETGPVNFVIRGTLDGKPVELKRTINLGRSASRPWVGRLWGQARVDHLLEDIALEGGSPEKQKEVVELALAYNFVTKYTSFLAIPENEATGEARRALDDARARKREILAKHRDATKLNNKAPMATAAMDPSGDFDGDDDDDDYDDAPDSGDVDRDEAHPGSLGKKNGCAGCASSSGGTGGALLALFVLICLGRRRKR